MLIAARSAWDSRGRDLEAIHPEGWSPFHAHFFMLCGAMIADASRLASPGRLRLPRSGTCPPLFGSAADVRRCALFVAAGLSTEYVEPPPGATIIIESTNRHGTFFAVFSRNLRPAGISTSGESHDPQ